MRYFYKNKEGNGYYCLKEPSNDVNLVEITEEEFYEHINNPQTPKEEIINQIALKKAELASTDYKCLKFVDGALTEEEYAPIKAQRAKLREEINELEAQL